MKKLLLLGITTLSGFSDLLFFTDFEDFSLGENQWAAAPQWATNNASPGVDSIDANAYGGAFGKTASLGFQRPSTTRTRILTPISHNPSTTNQEIIEIKTLIAVKDSRNGERDDFLFSLFHPNGTRLASIRLDNEDPLTSGSDFGFWREDGSTRFATGIGFIHEELYDLVLTINLRSNRWTATINGLPLFENAPFTNALAPGNLVLGAVGYEWVLTDPSPARHGDNFLFVGDLRIESFSTADPPQLRLTRNPDPSLELRWFGFAGKTYQLQSSPTLQADSWLADSTFTPTEIKRNFSVKVPSPSPSPRFFRLVTSE